MYHAYRAEIRAFRDEQYKVLLYDSRHTQLFDLQADPLEMHDLSSDSSQAQCLAAMTAQARQAGRELGDDPLKALFWRTLDNPAKPSAPPVPDKSRPAPRGR